MHIVIYLIFMKKLLLLAVFIAATLSSHAQVVINELMQSNIDCIMDDLNEFPDSWVELYNAGDVSVDLKDYKLGIKDDASKAYQLPSYTLAPKAYKIVYCDKYDGNKSWHAPFRLESGKDGAVYLFKGEEIVDQQTGMKKQPAPNIAYGRKKDGGDKWGYQATPTPNAANCGTVYGNKDIVGDPVFSVPGQVFETNEPIELTLSLPDGAPEGAKIIYTTDGSEPVVTDEMLGKGHWETKKALAWEHPNPNNSALLSWETKYRFSNRANYNAKEVFAIIPDDAWTAIKEREFYVDIKGTNPTIKVTNGWWNPQWGNDIKPGDERLKDNGDGTMTLTVNFAGDPILNELDQKHLLLTGTNYIPLRIFVTEYFWVDDAGTRAAVGPSASKVYTGEPLKITSSTVIRAKMICDGYLSPRSSAQSYIFHGRKMTLPVVSLVTDKEYFYGNQIGIYNSNNNADNKLDWRRPLNIEYFEAPNEDSKINQLGETRVAGGGSRNGNHKTLVIYANKRFDADKKRFSYEFFPEDRPGQTEFKSLMLRNSGNDYNYLFLRDALMQRSFYRHVDLDGQAYSPAIVYINGRYLGMLNIRERSNEDNIYTNYEKLEDIDMFENWWELKTGTWDNYNKFKDFYAEHGHTMAEFEEWMDCGEFANLMIMNIFYSNRDFPGNNIVMWRPIEEGGRWRWIAKDTDFGLGLYDHPYNYNTIRWIYDYEHKFDSSTTWANGSDHTRLFRRLMADPDFSRMFIDRCAVYMGDFLNYDRIWEELWSPMYERIKEEYPYHKKNLDWSVDYTTELANAQSWLKKRPDAFYSLLAAYYSLGAPVKLEINQNLSETELADIEVEMNGVKLTRGVFNGKYFKGNTVKLSGKQVRAWEISITSSKGFTQQTLEGEICEFVMPEATLVKVKAVSYNSIEQIGASEEAEAVDYFDLRGVRHDQLQRGQNIIRMSDGTVKKVLW